MDSFYDSGNAGGNIPAGNANNNATNIPEYSVSDLSGSIKRVLEGTFGRVRVRGEVTELKRYPSGHVYLSLKDEGGKISGVIWRSAVPRLGLAPENGMEVIATGRVSSYGERSSYQLIIDRMEFAGEGALLARIEQLRQKFLQEGLFDLDRKKKLPFLPRIIGVITSPSGAVLHDICTTISRRFPRDILLWPVAVQGEGAAASVAHAIEKMGRLPHSLKGASEGAASGSGDPASGIMAPDVIIVARGGGSLEDLMAFNDERVVRAVANCPIPLISAVGHETDTTLIDFASDRRAPTPTAAAEMAVPLRSELVADLTHRTARLLGGLSAILQERKMGLQNIIARMPDLPGLLDTAQMKLEDRSQRLSLALPAVIMQARARLGAPQCHMPPPEGFLLYRRNALSSAGTGLKTAWQRDVQQKKMRLLQAPLRPDSITSRLDVQRARLEGVARHLEAVSPKALLGRGYVLVQDEAGRTVTSSAELEKHAIVTLHFADAPRMARLDPARHEATGTETANRPRNASKEDKRTEPNRQGYLSL